MELLKSKMADRTTQLNTTIASAVEALGYDLVGHEYIGGAGAVLRVYIEKESGGITADDCAKVSRQIGSVLDVEDILPGHYLLEVSSPGLERPLFTLAHFKRFIGHKVHIHLRMKIEGQRNFTGLLQRVDDDVVTIVSHVGQELEQEHAFSLTDIEKAHLISDIGKK